MATSRSLGSILLLLPSSCLCLFFFLKFATAAAVTDPREADALKTIFQRWGIITSSPDWNIGGDPCTGAAFNGSNIYVDEYKPMITCECNISSAPAGEICHITQLKVSKLDVTGQIPQELQSFEHLQFLDLSRNYLTGPVPAFFGNFTNLEHLYLPMNALSGSIPQELGNLKNLVVLDLGINKFSGTIPPEFGGMINLKRWYMDSSGLTGELPSQLSNLANLEILWASDNNLTGKLPDFFGRLRNLTELRLQGNSFEGPIPISFSNLNKMKDLRIGDMMNGATSSTLQFIGNMAFLQTLILRNCKIYDALPSDFSQYKSLETLDLSFNNIIGSIPQSLFMLTNLTFLFLGNNSLSGSLPSDKIISPLKNVDLSYNQLTGSLPYWMAEPNLQLNIVANNFVISESDTSNFPVGLKCLQNDRPCFRDPPKYHSFAVNCGGSRAVTTSDDITYESDDANLSSASYYVSDQTKWAVSTINNSSTLNGSSEFQKTSYSELFQSSRLSTSSLRYYGLGLENGNYTVKLQFAETQISDGPTWTSLGRRIFDIYIQSVLKEKDFDIRKEAGGASFTAVEKEYTAPVTNNFLEIHLFWAGKGTKVVPYDNYYGPSISAISVSPKDFIPASSKNHTGLAVGLVVGAAIIALTILCLVLLRIRRKEVSKENHEIGDSGVLLHGIIDKPDIFSYAVTRIATEEFSSSNLLGEGGYGPVFKGKLPDGRIVAVKQLSVTSHQGKHQFMAEIETISAVKHVNLVKLLGYCVEGGTHILVYEFLENKSLDQVIFGNSELHLDWPKRFEVCLGVARGLAYLHEEAPVRIVHRDVKASNILLDVDLKPKISDFGLAKLYDEKRTHVSTKVAGTIGYLAPEYAMRGHLTKKADVYAFGVLCLEILAGRPNSDHSLEAEKIYLLEWAWYLHENKRELELVDRSLSSFNKDEVDRVISLALLCTQSSPAQRPPMSRVVAMLVGDVVVPAVTMKPIYLDWQANGNDIDSEASDNISTSSLLINSQRAENSSSAGTQATIMSTSFAVDSMLNSFIQGGR